MTHSIGIGVIGMGWMGTVHSRAYRQIADRFADAGIEPRLIICADDVAARAEHARRALGFSEATTDWRAVIEHPDVQVVNIAAPNFLHLEMVRAAADAGKHIFCEKPVGRTPEETAEIEWLARRAGVMSFVGFNYRWAPMVQYARQLIEEGRLGRLTHYRGRFFAMYGSNPLGLLTWRFKAGQAGLGVLGDIMSHVVDMAHMLAGPIARVVSHRHTFIRERPLPIPGQGTHFSLGQPGDPTGPVENEDYVGALVEFENGVQGSFETCRAIFGPKCEMSFEVNGDQGALKWNFERMNELELYLPDGTPARDGYTRLLGGPAYPFHGRFNPGDGIGIGYEDLKTIEAYAFLQSIVDGKPRAPSFADALALANVQQAMIRSWESGRWEPVVSLRIDNESVAS
ncbi:MAG TPA: Gfo/Idh/MocA family oxidoreductase [Caldilineaceae bacterium]|nr:Gfo/Idh/MocA family oxidoreductase [Caldilineaceae bacterium]